MTTRHRLLVGAIALAAGMYFLASATAAPPSLSKDLYKKLAEADIAQLQKTLETCNSDASMAKRHGPTAKSLAMSLALTGEATGDKDLKDQALKVADAIASKKFSDAAAAAKGLAAKPGKAPLTPSDLSKKAKFALDEVMSPFRGGNVGGLNIEKDIRALRDGKLDVNPTDVEILAARTALLLDYATVMPNCKALVNKAKTTEWEKLSKDSVELSKKISDEAAKGKKADSKEIVKMIKLLDAKCTDCHRGFRDD